MKSPSRSRGGFSLIELMVVLAIVGLLAATLISAMGQAMQQARSATCGNNLKQLFTANQLFAQEHGSYVPAAADIMGRNLKRWHGERASSRQPFMGDEGPLASYLEADAGTRRCPVLLKQLKPNTPNAFESACGGYGYNQVGIGSTSYAAGFNRNSAERGIDPDRLDHPVTTLMFAETAFPQPYNNPDALIEYSFVEPYFHLQWNATAESGRPARPSMHFRHRSRSGVIWADGHASVMSMKMSDASSEAFQIGWPGGANNDLFKPFDL